MALSPPGGSPGGERSWSFLARRRKSRSRAAYRLCNRPDPGHDDNIVPGEELVLMEAIDLPQAAADPVADHRVAQLGPGGEAQAALPPGRFFRQ